MLPDNLIKKVYALAYAVFRIAGISENAAIKNALEESAMKSLTLALEGNVAGSKEALNIMEYLLGFGRDTGRIDVQSAEMVLMELDGYRAELKEKSDIKTSAAALAKDELFPDLKMNRSMIQETIEVGIFEKDNTRKDPRSGGEINPAIYNPAIAELKHGPTIIPHEANFSNKANGSNDEGFNKRKEAILQKIRQSGNCRMRDVQEMMVNTSERTLRYDLQRLVAEGLIERIGNGGPATYYRLRVAGQG